MLDKFETLWLLMHKKYMKSFFPLKCMTANSKISQDYERYILTSQRSSSCSLFLSERSNLASLSLLSGGQWVLVHCAKYFPLHTRLNIIILSNTAFDFISTGTLNSTFMKHRSVFSRSLVRGEQLCHIVIEQTRKQLSKCLIFKFSCIEYF